jgi:hypothetical protein
MSGYLCSYEDDTPHEIPEHIKRMTPEELHQHIEDLFAAAEKRRKENKPKPNPFYKHITAFHTD